MEKIAFYDVKPYDLTHFLPRSREAGLELKQIEARLTADTAVLAQDSKTVCAFVNDVLDADCITALKNAGTEAVFLRCAGYNNVDLDAARREGIRVFRVPAYSPESVAEHAAALMFTLARSTHRAFTRTRERNFSLEGLVGMELRGKTVGVIGTGKVGAHFCSIAAGLGMEVIASDPYPNWKSGIRYATNNEIFRRADVISLHCPLTQDTFRLLDSEAFRKMKDGVMIINTSRGALIDSEALLAGIKSGKVGAAGLDVYEEEADVFYEDVSMEIMKDDTLNLLLSQPKVLVTGHQAFLTGEALSQIARITVENVTAFLRGKECENEVTRGVTV